MNGFMLTSVCRYTDEAAYAAHSETEHFKATMKKATEAGALAGLEVMKLEPLSNGKE